MVQHFGVAYLWRRVTRAHSLKRVAVNPDTRALGVSQFDASRGDGNFCILGASFCLRNFLGGLIVDSVAVLKLSEGLNNVDRGIQLHSIHAQFGTINHLLL